MRRGILRNSIVVYSPLRRAFLFKDGKKMSDKFEEENKLQEEISEVIEVSKAPGKSKLKVMLEHRTASKALPGIMKPQDNMNAYLDQINTLLDKISVEALTIEQNLKGTNLANEYGPETCQNWNIFQEKLQLLSEGKPTITNNEMMLKIMKIK